MDFGAMFRGKHNPPKDTNPSFAGRTIVVTGSNTGVGFEASVKFVQLGAARVILAVRSIKKGEDARMQIEQRTGRKGVAEVWELDMLDYGSIKAFAARVDEEVERLDIAVLNAGIFMATFQKSSYGWEKVLQVNVLSTSLLGLLLLPKLKASKTADFTPVLELVSSGNHFNVTTLATDPDSGAAGPLETYNHPATFNAITQYNISKLFLEYGHAGLAALATSPATGKPDVTVVSICPGATKSNLARDNTAWYMRAALFIFALLFQRSTEEGARTYISGAALGEKGHGQFWQDDRISEPAPLLSGEKGEKLQAQVWHEIVVALQKDVPEVDGLLKASG
ncbi:hypothetical protein LTR36_010809 [Oleoguttula mirabilis]|uniref:Uncharacterized protein n=1 Tax=Oleoguttula mirabilis TaxID=1507867 RepID=A0AAV9JR67_9PEZI|nr:hypothetical protein LTR36_010809 [Oleoguttula mirabilis]